MLLNTDRYSTFRQDLVEVELPGHRYGSHPCGYVTPSGTVFECEPYGHMDMLEGYFVRTGHDDFYRQLFEEYQDYCFRNDVHESNNYSMYDEFALVEMGWVKIAAYGVPGSSGPMETWDYNYYLIRTRELTPEQISVIYPK